MSDSMHGKVVLVTGATAGIGEVTTRELARLGATVVGVARNPQKAAQVAQTIQAATGVQVNFLIADLSSLAQVRHLADEFKRKYNRLDVLINNAGAVNTSRRETVDGYEMTFALNHLSYFLLTNLLLDLLQASAPSRIVNVSSDASRGGRINFDDIEGRRGYSGWSAYSQSKLANILFTFELARRLQGTGVTANVLHPGFVATNFGHNNGGLMALGLGLFQRVAALKPDQGAATQIYLASSPEVEGVTGRYFDKSKAVQAPPAAYDEAAARRLWELSEQMTAERVLA
ncbi:MAG: SDR family oxidoreductase [Anaerolineae bacterium]|nr:SDR family oxidoreductase [Anaerolineae bacterium]